MSTHQQTAKRMLWAALFAASLSFAQARPNIILILVDDLGWSELGCYGDRFFETPHLDRLAKQGMRFTDAYAPAPICSAARAGFLTGRTPARTHLEFVVKRQGDAAVIGNTRLLQPPFTLDLSPSELTIPELLGPAGYQTGIYGKWHLNQDYRHYLGWNPANGPRQQGFDEGDGASGAHPVGYKERDFGPFEPGEFPPDLMTENAIAFLARHRTEPFFLYYSSYYPHEPVHTRCRWLYDKYAAKSESRGAAGDRAMYGAFIEQMDHYIGQLLTAVDDLGLADNTLVIFTSDNGSAPAYHYRNLLRGSKWDLHEGGIRVPMIARWPGVIPPGSLCRAPVNGTDLLPTFCAVADTAIPAGLELDGRSLVPLLRDPDTPAWSERSLYWHFPYYHPRQNLARPQSAIRRGAWKLILFHEDQTSQLFNLERDIGEHVDLSGDDPEKTAELRADLTNYLQQADARLPTPNPAYDVTRGWKFLK